MNANDEYLESRLNEIGTLVNTQDNRITSHPVFVIEKKVRDFGYDADFASDYVWVDYGNDCNEADGEQHRNLDRIFSETGRSLDLWERCYYNIRWEFVTCCFTEQGCRDYLNINGHNVGESRIYVYSGWRNHEWQQVRAALMAGIQVINECS